MHVECSACGARYTIADEKIPAGGARVRCRKCQAVFAISKAPPAPVDLPLIPPTPSAPTAPAPARPPEPEFRAAEPPAPEPPQAAAPDSPYTAGFEIERTAPPPIVPPVSEPPPGPEPRLEPQHPGPSTHVFELERLGPPAASETPAPSQEFERMGAPFGRSAGEELPPMSPEFTQSFDFGGQGSRASAAPSYAPPQAPAPPPAAPAAPPPARAHAAPPQAPAQAPVRPAPAPPAPARPAAAASAPAAAPTQVPATASGIPAGLPEAERLKHERARRLARVLASDIAIYNKEKRERGVKEGNLVAVLGYEIKKSWEVYKERVTPELANSTPYFRDALNEMLAEGKKVF